MAADQRHIRFQYAILPPELRKNVLRYTTPADTYALSRTPGSVALVAKFYIDMERALFGAENDPPLDENERRRVQQRWRAYDYGCYLIQHGEENAPQDQNIIITLVTGEIARRSALLGPGLRSVDLWIDYDPRKFFVALSAIARVPGENASMRFTFLMRMCSRINYTAYFASNTFGNVTEEVLDDTLDSLNFQRYVTDIASKDDLPGRVPGTFTVENLVRNLALAAAQAGNANVLLQLFCIDEWQTNETWEDMFEGLNASVFFNATRIIPQSMPQYTTDVKSAIRMLENERKMFMASMTLLTERPIAWYFDTS